MSKHTPGPWSVREDIGAVFDRDGLPIATGGSESYEEYQANARLIAAAPELLEACKQAYDVIDDMDGPWNLDRIYNTLKVAIAKAEGKRL